MRKHTIKMTFDQFSWMQPLVAFTIRRCINATLEAEGIHIPCEINVLVTCDPICGLVQIPCIERNAVAANRAMNACNLSYFLTGSRNISYDMVCRAMKETGVNLDHRFRETSEGGLAKLYNRKKSHS